MALFPKKTEPARPQADLTRLPRHIAIIMDGNGRWAKKRGLPRTAGHAAGAETFRTIATYCKEIGLEYLTVYAFSSENWKRPEEEVGAIMGLLKKYLLEAISRMERDRVKMEFFGDHIQSATKIPLLLRLFRFLSLNRASVEPLHGLSKNPYTNYLPHLIQKFPAASLS